MLTLQEISDRLEIQDLVWRYSELLDTRDFDKMRDEIFTPDAFIDYTEFGGSQGDVEETIAFLKKAMKIFPAYQHMNANIQIKLGHPPEGEVGETARGRVMCYNPQQLQPAEGEAEGEGHIFVCGLWYHDEYVRTEAGWRIRKRVEQKSYVMHPPAFMRSA